MTESDKNNNEKPYKLGIALSGGGARGVAHAGALLAIEEAGLKPDIIAGVSAGSIVAVLYSAGVRPHQILEMFLHSKFSDFTEFTFGKGGFFRIDKFMKLIMGHMKGYTDLAELPIPTYIGVTNFDEGKAEEFHSGDIYSIVKASSSIPIAIPPVDINGTTYVDGGVLRNLPAWTIRDKCERLIGINVSPLNTADKATSLYDIALRTYSLMAKSNQNADMSMCDLLVLTKEISHYGTFNLKDVQKIYLSGYANTRKKLRDAGWWRAGQDSANDEQKEDPAEDPKEDPKR